MSEILFGDAPKLGAYLRKKLKLKKTYFVHKQEPWRNKAGLCFVSSGLFL